MKNLEKILLRKVMSERQKNLTGSYIEKAGKNIQAQILSSQLYKNSRKIFIYISTEQEPPTIEIIKQAFEDGKEIYVPKCVKKDMYAVRIYDFNSLITGKLGIWEPIDCSETLEAKEFDLIIVPCLSASLDGKRLGHGGGYYDKFLAGCRKNQNIICLCFYEMLNSDIPMKEHDIYVTEVLTENFSSYLL